MTATRSGLRGNTAARALFLVLAIVGNAGCGDDKHGTGVGGAGGQAGLSGGAGSDVPSATGGLGGTAGGGQGGGAGGDVPSTTGGNGGGGGAGHQAASTGGLGGQGGGAGGGAGGSYPCASSACVEGAVRCSGAAPQSCQRDTMGCTFWGTPAQQPAVCSANQRCVAATGTCACNDDPRCGTPPATGDFCPSPNASTRASCNQAADGCFTVRTDAPCATDQVCETAVPGAVVPTGMACGCAPPLDDQSGNSLALLGTACTDAQAADGAHLGSPADQAVLICKPSGSCNTWQVLVACQLQQLIGGVDPVTSQPACVCPPPAVKNQYYVDPDPAMSTFMTGQPTGAQFPSACRYRTLTTALVQSGVTEAVAAHESSSNVHFKTLRSSPAVTSCNAANSCESFPLTIPAGVHVYTTDVGSFNPAHYVIDVDATSNKGYAVMMGDQAVLEGFTIDASATNPSGVNAGKRVAAVLVSPLIGAWTATPSAAPVTARLNQVLILASAVLASGAGAQTALLVQGQAAWTADYLSIIGGAGTTRGIVIDHATDPVAGTTASLVATHLNVSVSGGTGQLGIELGSNGRDNGVAGSGGPVAADAGNALTVTNDPALDGAGAFTPHRVTVGPLGVGVHVFNGTATLTGLDVAGDTQGFTGYRIDRSNAPAAAGVVIHQGSVSGAGTAGGVGVLATGGFTTLDGVHVTGGDGWYGVSVRQTPGSAVLAGDVTVTGTATAPAIIDVATPLGATAATAGIQVGLGDEYTTFDVTAPPATVALPRLTIDDNTVVTHYVDGVVVNNGHVRAQGNVQLTANLRDGLQVLSSLALTGTDPNDPEARAAFTGTSFTGNGRAGVLLRTVVPVLLDQVKVIGNGVPIGGSALPAFPDGTGGIDIQRSQLGLNTAFLANVFNSTVTGNVGCGITLSGGGDDLVNRVTAAGDGVRVCGLGTGFAIDGSPTGSAAGRVAGPLPGTRAGDATTETPAPQGIFGGRTNVGGKVAAFIKNTYVQNNSGVGIYVTEARDFDPTLVGDDVTDVSLQNNVVTGNLNVVAPTGTEPAAGGIYFASSNLTSTDTPNTRPVEVNDLGCEDRQDASIDHVVCTRLGMSSFLGNVIACNGRGQLAFGVPQRINTSAAGISPQGDWDISSDGTIVGISLSMRCADAASPNTLAGYSAVAQNMGLIIPTSATTNDGVSLLHIAAYGVKWNDSTIVAGSDYSAALAGNGDTSKWGVCPGVTPVSCPVVPASP